MGNTSPKEIKESCYKETLELSQPFRKYFGDKHFVYTSELDLSKCRFRKGDERFIAKCRAYSLVLSWSSAPERSHTRMGLENERIIKALSKLSGSMSALKSLSLTIDLGSTGDMNTEQAKNSSSETTAMCSASALSRNMTIGRERRGTARTQSATCQLQKAWRPDPG